MRGVQPFVPAEMLLDHTSGVFYVRLKDGGYMTLVDPSAIRQGGLPISQHRGVAHVLMDSKVRLMSYLRRR